MEIVSHSVDLFTPSSPGGLTVCVLTTKGSLVPIAKPFVSPLTPVAQEKYRRPYLFVLAETDRPTMAYMASRVEAVINGSCSERRDRIVESFVVLMQNMTESRSLCRPHHRCRMRNAFVHCSDDKDDVLPPSSTSSGENLTVDFVLETESRPSGRPATLDDQRLLLQSLDNVYYVLDELVTDGELAWSTRDSRIFAVTVDSALVEFQMDNCTAGQVLNDLVAEVPTCRKCKIH